ncbi:unnamed protein product [Protopolystoma xenopodis]|uniref:Uncharacterized protein n=1 Tax=Protopolystoma xenopodis TaxID=117903 RepID=A0A448XG63_9PLAT|nr:unnamed protein product [Protopolystoma xenopodis]
MDVLMTLQGASNRGIALIILWFGCQDTFSRSPCSIPVMPTWFPPSVGRQEWMRHHLQIELLVAVPKNCLTKQRLPSGLINLCLAVPAHSRLPRPRLSRSKKSHHHHPSYLDGRGTMRPGLRSGSLRILSTPHQRTWAWTGINSPVKSMQTWRKQKQTQKRLLCQLSRPRVMRLGDCAVMWVGQLGLRQIRD